MLFDTFGQSTAPTARFAHVTQEQHRPPSWVAAHSRGFAGGPANPLALKPARLPDDLAQMENAVHADAFPNPPQPEPPPIRRPTSSPAPPLLKSVHPAPTPPPPELSGPDPEATAAFLHAAEQFRTAAQQLMDARQATLAETESQLVALATTIARRVIATELKQRPEIVATLVREGLEALGDNDRLSIRIGSGFGEGLELIRSELGNRSADSRISVDPSLADYACLIETHYGRVDESVEVRLAQILAALSPDSDSQD